MSPKFSLNSEDVQKWFKNIQLFFAPLVLTYIASVVPRLDDGVAWSDFSITTMVGGAMVLYVLNALTDILKKYTADPA